jgi:hypothetical protein
MAKHGWQMICVQIHSEGLAQVCHRSLKISTDKQVKEVDDYFSQEDKQTVNKYSENSSTCL